VRRFVALGSAAVLAVSVGGAAARSAGTIRITVTPSVSRLGTPAAIAVTGIGTPELEARLKGAADRSGEPTGWTPLHLVGGSWHGTLPAPLLHGIYPVQLHVGTRTIEPRRRLFRVFSPRVAGEPGFEHPFAVVRWWVAGRHATLAAWRRWPLSPDDHRDRRLHRLFVIAYRRRGRPELGVFITAVRDGYSGRWKLLEATVEPPAPVPAGAQP
jgi:hypothetical protein